MLPQSETGKPISCRMNYPSWGGATWKRCDDGARMSPGASRLLMQDIRKPHRERVPVGDQEKECYDEPKIRYPRLHQSAHLDVVSHGGQRQEVHSERRQHDPKFDIDRHHHADLKRIHGTCTEIILPVRERRARCTRAFSLVTVRSAQLQQGEEPLRRHRRGHDLSVGIT